MRDLLKIPLLAEAELPMTTPSWGGAVRPCLLKSVLWTLWAFEGERLTYEAVADRSGMTRGNARRAIDGLVNLRIVTADTDRRFAEGRRYRIDADRLSEFRCKGSLFVSRWGERAVRNRRAGLMKTLARKAAAV